MSRRSFDDPTSDAARRALLDNRAERSHPKRHRTRRRSAARKAKAKRQIEAKVAKLRKDRARYLRFARAYWSGEAPEHP